MGTARLDREGAIQQQDLAQNFVWSSMEDCRSNDEPYHRGKLVPNKTKPTI